MVDKSQILIKYYREQKSERAISRELKINRKTVHRYISEHESEIKSDDITTHLEQGLSFKPRYKSQNRTKRVLTLDIEQEINSCLKKNKEKINNGMRKQIMKKIDIFNYLQEKNLFHDKYSTLQGRSNPFLKLLFYYFYLRINLINNFKIKFYRN